MQPTNPAAMNISRIAAAIVVVLLVLAVGCSPEPVGSESSASIAEQQPDPAALQAAIESAIDQATDLPQEALLVEVSDGAVTIAGSIACEECGGLYTPGNVGTIQQSLGAVVRAVPGVESVSFELSTP